MPDIREALCDGHEVEIPAGLPLGITSGTALMSITSREGNRFTFVSDGVVEAANLKGEFFGFDRTREMSTKPRGKLPAPRSRGARTTTYPLYGNKSRGGELMRFIIGLLFFSCLTCAQVRFQFGDDPRWADPKFDDSSWKSAGPDYFPIPASASDGMVWPRDRVPVPPDARPLAIRLTREDADCVPEEVWVNGVRVGSQGRFHPMPEVRARCATDVFDLPAGLVSPGGTAIVAWRGWIPPLLRTPLPYVSPHGSVLMVVGDVSGKGLSAAMTVAAIAGALDNVFSRDPAEVLTHLNRALLARKSGGFVTSCAVLMELTGDVTIADAGH